MIASFQALYFGVIFAVAAWGCIRIEDRHLDAELELYWPGKLCLIFLFLGVLLQSEQVIAALAFICFLAGFPWCTNDRKADQSENSFLFYLSLIALFLANFGSLFTEGHKVAAYFFGTATLLATGFFFSLVGIVTNKDRTNGVSYANTPSAQTA